MHSGKLTLRNAHCSAPPLRASFHLPRLSREAEAVLRPRAPLWPTKREVRESEASSAEFSLGKADAVKVKVEADVEVAQDPRQLCAQLAAVRIERPAPTASSSSSDVAGPSGTAYRTQALRRIPTNQLGPADPPRGRPKGSKNRLRVALTFGTSAPPERAEVAKARAKMAPKK